MRKLIAFFLVMVVALTAFANDSGRKKFIGHSWDLLWVSPDTLAKNLPALEALPLDGISICLYGEKEPGKMSRLVNVYADSKWERKWLEKQIPVVKKICGGNLKNNIMTTMWAPPKRLAWDDDAKWETAANNIGVIAWMSKECGARGILLDPEDYTKADQYKYIPEIDKGSYEETAALARKRGAQMMKAMGTNHPEGVFLSFWFFSMAPQIYLVPGDAKENAKSSGDLWVHFLNGFLDTIPPKAIMVDACEYAYHYKFETMDFFKSALDITRTALRIVEPENRSKYRNQVQVGFGLYLDMYTNEKKSIYYFPELNGSRLNRLHANFSQAMQVTDEFCWVYGEKYRWIKWDWTRKDTAETWEQKLPGFELTLAAIANPKKVVDKWYAENKKAGSLVNLLKNPQCSPDNQTASLDNPAADWKSGSLPKGWGFWQVKKKGKIELDTTEGFGDKFSAKADSIGNGCFIVKTDVVSGGVYAVEAYAKGQGRPTIRVRWQYNGEWRSPELDGYINFEEDAGNGWKKALGIITVPAEINQLVVLMNNNLNPGETCNFDMPAVYKVEFNNK